MLPLILIMLIFLMLIITSQDSETETDSEVDSAKTLLCRPSDMSSVTISTSKESHVSVVLNPRFSTTTTTTTPTPHMTVKSRQGVLMDIL